MKRLAAALVSIAALGAAPFVAQGKATKSLEIYIIDAEGGKAVLWSYNAALEGNSPGLLVANIDDAATIAGVLTAPPRGGGRGPGNATAAHTPAYWLKVSARSAGTFTVSNSRNGFSKTYTQRPSR
jgi:hypothetical protein